MKHKEKQLEYARQYQTMSVKELQKVVFSGEKKFNLDGPNGFFKYLLAKKFPEKITQHGILKEDRFSSSGKLKLQFVSGRQKAADYMKMLHDISLAQEGRRLCEEEWIFQQDNAVIHNASIKNVTRKVYFYPRTGFYFRTCEDGAGWHLIPYRISPRSEFFSQAYKTWHITCGINLGPD